MNRIPNLPILCFVLLTSLFCYHLELEPPLLIKGTLDLSDYSFHKKPTLPLAGEWKFTPGKLHLMETGDTIFVTIPDTPHWNSYNPNHKDSEPGLGIGSYLITIIPPKEKTNLAIDFTLVFSDCAIFQNGIQIGSIGNIYGKNEDFDRRPKQINLLPANGEPIQLTILFRNRFYQAGGIRFLPILGDTESLANDRDKEIFEQSLVVGGLLFLGLYQLGVFFTRGRIIGSLYFFLFCLVMALQVLTTGARSLFLLVGENSSELIFRIDFFSQYAGAILGLLYFYSLTKEYIRSYFIYALIGIILFPIGITIFGSIYTISSLHLYVLMAVITLFSTAIYLIVRYIRDRRDGYIYLGLSAILLIGCASNDIILSLLHKTQPMLLAYGLLLFVFFQSLFLSKHIANEILTAELNLKSAQYQLVQSEKLSSLGVMVASVAHEINSPLSAVIASGEAIEEKISELFHYLPDSEPIPRDSFPIFLSIVDLALAQKESASTKETRQTKRNFTEYLESIGFKDAEKNADLFVSLGIKEIPEDWIQILKNKNGKAFFALADKVVSVLQGTKTIHLAANRAIKITQSLKEFTHFDPKGEKQIIQISRMMDIVLTILNNSLKQGIELTTEYEETSAIECYPDELNQVWINLIQNSIQSMNGKGKLKIKIGKTEIKNKHYVYVSIEDSGPGIPKEIQSKIFDPFFTTKPMGEGTGLGLYITKQVIEKHLGMIQLNTKPGETIFTVLLPDSNDSNTKAKENR